MRMAAGGNPVVMRRVGVAFRFRSAQVSAWHQAPLPSVGCMGAWRV